MAAVPTDLYRISFHRCQTRNPTWHHGQTPKIIFFKKKIGKKARKFREATCQNSHIGENYQSQRKVLEKPKIAEGGRTEIPHDKTGRPGHSPHSIISPQIFKTPSSSPSSSSSSPELHPTEQASDRSVATFNSGNSKSRSDTPSQIRCTA